MGRGVSYPSGAIVAYASHDCEECFDFQRCVLEPFQYGIKELFPSAAECDEWIGREDHALAENGFAYFGVSEYCGMIAYWIAPKECYDCYESRDYSPLRDRWLGQVEDKFFERFSEFRKLATMSNGISVFESVA